MEEYTLVFDGGSQGNPGRSYGSYRIQPKNERPLKPVHLQFGHGTNNEAEYQALLAGIKATMEVAEGRGSVLAGTRLVIRGDSQLVLNQLKGSWKAKDQRMKAFRDDALELLSKFGAVRLIHQSRNETVKILGH